MKTKDITRDPSPQYKTKTLWDVFINGDDVVINHREHCAICDSSNLNIAIDLPGLPLTGIYCQEAMKGPIKGIDQRLLICVKCGHIQLLEYISPAVLYSDNYSFRTSFSVTARQGTSFFLSALNEIVPNKHFNCVLDLGCNDLYLLEQLQGRANVRIGIDPVWASREDQGNDKSITIIGDAIENVDLHLALKTLPDLIVCRHTLEHIYEPRLVLQQLFDVADENTLFLFEVPGFEALVYRLRFDQIFHQHLQYFTIASFRQLLQEVGGVYVSHWENYHDWGSLLVAFTKKGKRQKQYDKIIEPMFDISAIRKRYAIFRRELSTVNDILKSLKGTIVYGYGAARMLPILAYHLNNDLSSLTALLDDHGVKDGLYYWNLPLIIRHTATITDIGAASIFITAVDSVKPILGKLLTQRPRHIIYPFHII